MQQLQLNNCIYIIDEAAQKCTTVFSDGSKVDAVPMDRQLPTALSIGYANTWELTKFHDLIHNLLAEAKGLNHSDVLYDVAKGKAASQTHWLEEETVLLIQQIINRLADLKLIHYGNT